MNIRTVRTITGPDDLYPEGTEGISWNDEPVFQFATEVDALRTLQLLGEDLAAARENVRHITRHLEAAARAARQGTAEGPVTPQAIINESGVARRTVYKWIAD